MSMRESSNTIKARKEVLSNPVVTCVYACDAMMLGWLPWAKYADNEFSPMGKTTCDTGMRFNVIKDVGDSVYLFSQLTEYIFVISLSDFNSNFTVDKSKCI